jgi:septal ring factor EnvC (AmiA/AmiB activator)
VEGWPTLADVHAAVMATRAEVRGLCAELAAQRRELAQHRQDDRRELDALGKDLDELDTRVAGLAGRERWLAGGLALLGLLVVGIGVPVTVALL